MTDESNLDKTLARGTSLADEIEKAAQALEIKDFPLASLCLGKALKHVEPPHGPGNPIPHDSSPDAEIHKMLQAIEDGMFSMAAFCLRKAIAGLKAGDGPELRVQVLDAAAAVAAAEDLARSLEEEDHSGAATHLRNLAAQVG